jgi:restriction system protein
MFEFFIHSTPAIILISEGRSVADELFRITSQDNQDASDPDPASPDSIGGFDNAELERTRSIMLAIPPQEFERFIARLFELSGFTRVQTTVFQGDGGIDLDAYVGPANLFFAGTHVQAQVKRWRHTVGSIEINGFRGALASTAKGIFVSTGYFSRAAIQEAGSVTKPCISLVDGRKLAGLCIRRELLP